MATICPRCGKLDDRPQDQNDGQCPHCGVLYEKARHAAAESRKVPEAKPVAPRVIRGFVYGASLLAIGFFLVQHFDDQDAETGDRPQTHQVTTACADSIRSAADRPDTVSVSYLTAESTQVPDGTIAVRLHFSAENEQGIEIDYIARCNVTAEGEVQSFNTQHR
ncbi:hypothetical protein [Thioalkalivibrio sp. ALJ8]|uniref:hypothetical protein n=1 Tax=Thioalkalivibrio sp. ALJ8 TaxID=1158757 RepID=UPI0003790E4F|nr:hypothetical protein [Thioalkalivibrio sp. ALJ8]